VKKLTKIMVSFSKEIYSESINGRLLILLSKDPENEPRFQISPFPNTQQIFGIDVNNLKPGEIVEIPNDSFGFPVNSLNKIPTGLYAIQALIHKYETFHRADGTAVNLPMDRGEGQKWNKAPGNLYSIPKQMNFNSNSNDNINIVIDQVIESIEDPENTIYIRYEKIESKLLTNFWGRPMYLGAVILLPEGFDEHPETKYPLVVWHGHFNRNHYANFRETPPDPNIEPEPSKSKSWKTTKDLYGPDVSRSPEYIEAPNIVSQRNGYKLYKDWKSPGFPRMIIACIQHATPYYDDSYAVNSANQGPYGDAINHELIPYIEEKYRAIGEGWARTTMGGSTGGWEALATQIFYPEMYNGCWAWCPDSIDFRDFSLVNIYADSNAYYVKGPWNRVARPGFRSTVGEILYTIKDENHLEHVKGTQGRSGGQWDIWFATFGPINNEGYVKFPWNKITGKIDPEVTSYWKENYDLRHILQRDWKILGPNIKGKIHLFCGDMDGYYLNNAVYLMEEFLESTRNPYYAGRVEYGWRRGHCWYGDNTRSSTEDRANMVQRHIKEMAEHIRKTAPENADTTSWRY